MLTTLLFLLPSLLGMLLLLLLLPRLWLLEDLCFLPRLPLDDFEFLPRRTAGNLEKNIETFSGMTPKDYASSFIQSKNYP